MSITDELREIIPEIDFATNRDRLRAIADLIDMKHELGRGTCKDVGRYCFSCSECGWAANEPHHVLGGFWPNYCPNCGRKVVDDASVD